MEGLGINLGYLIIQIIAFIVIYVLLSRFLYDPLSNMLRNRRTVLFTLVLPAALFFSFSGTAGWDESAGHGNVAAYVMVSMALYGATRGEDLTEGRLRRGDHTQAARSRSRDGCRFGRSTCESKAP